MYALGTRTELWVGHGGSGLRTLSQHERNYALGMDALVSVCSWNTNINMLWAWMVWSSLYAFRTQTEPCFGHGCSGCRMLLEHQCYYGLGMDPLVTVYSWNTNVIRLFAFGSAAASGLCCWSTRILVSKIIKMCLGARPLTDAISKNKKRNSKENNSSNY